MSYTKAAGNTVVVYTSDHGENNGEHELYDLEAAPGEFTNLADDPNHAGTVATLHGAMLDELGEDPDDTEQRCRADIARGYGRAAPPPKSSR